MTNIAGVQKRLRIGVGLIVVVALEIAIAMVLLVASGLLLRSFAGVLAVDPGFEPTRTFTASLSLPIHAYPTQQKAHDFYQELQRRLEIIPAVASVGFSSNIPIVGQNSGRLISPEGYLKPSGRPGSLRRTTFFRAITSRPCTFHSSGDATFAQATISRVPHSRSLLASLLQTSTLLKETRSVCI